MEKLVKNTIWNTAGFMAYFACQWFITLIVVWLSEDYINAGNLSLAMNITNFFHTIAIYNVRNFQVSDIKGEYNDSEYVMARVLTCVGSIVLCAAFVFFADFTAMQRAIIICYMIFRTTETFTDVFHGIDQKKWKMEYIGISLITRGIAMLTAFTVLVWLFNLLIAAIGMAVVTWIIAVVYDVPKTKKIAEFSKYAWSKVFSLLRRCFPLMIVTLSAVVIVIFARYSVERIYDEEALGVYATATTPTLVVQVVIFTLFAPLANLLTECLKNNNRARFIKISGATFALIVALTLGLALGAYFLGEWGLGLLFGESIIPYAFLLPGACFVTGLTGAMWFMNVIFSALRDIKWLLICNVIGVVICFAATDFFLVNYGLEGANHVMNISQGVAVLCMILRLLWFLRSKWETAISHEDSAAAVS